MDAKKFPALGEMTGDAAGQAQRRTTSDPEAALAAIRQWKVALAQKYGAGAPDGKDADSMDQPA